MKVLVSILIILSLHAYCDEVDFNTCRETKALDIYELSIPTSATRCSDEFICFREANCQVQNESRSIFLAARCVSQNQECPSFRECYEQRNPPISIRSEIVPRRSISGGVSEEGSTQ